MENLKIERTLRNSLNLFLITKNTLTPIILIKQNLTRTMGYTSLVIFPDGDMAWKPEEGEKIANILLNSEFNLIKNAGHYIQEDAGEEVAEIIVQFLKRND